MRSMADVFRKLEQQYPVIAFIRCTVIVVVAYVIVDRGVRIASHLARSDYDAPLLWIGALRWLGLHWVLAVPAIAFYAFSCFRARGTWLAFDSSLLLKQIIIVPVLIVAWSYSLYAYNAYYDQSHWVDRALMVVFAAGAVWRPQLVLLCLYQARLIAWQFDYPLVGQFSMVETEVPFHLLALIPALLSRAPLRHAFRPRMRWLLLSV